MEVIICLNSFSHNRPSGKGAALQNPRSHRHLQSCTTSPGACATCAARLFSASSRRNTRCTATTSNMRGTSAALRLAPVASVPVVANVHFCTHGLDLPPDHDSKRTQQWLKIFSWLQLLQGAYQRFYGRQCSRLVCSSYSIF